MIRNVLKRRRECGTYLATARRHRRRLKMQKRDESRSFQPALRPSSDDLTRPPPPLLPVPPLAAPANTGQSSSTADEGRSAG